MMNSWCQQMLKILQYRNHRLSIALRCISKYKEDLLFLASIYFAIFVVTSDNYGVLPYGFAIGIMFFIVLIALDSIASLRIYNELKQCAYKLADEEKVKLHGFDQENYIKWATMESYLLYEKKMKEGFSSKHKNLILFCRIGYLMCMFSAILLVMGHLMLR